MQRRAGRLVEHVDQLAPLAGLRFAVPMHYVMSDLEPVVATAFERALALGAEPYVGKIGPMELSIPAIRGIGGSLLYFVDRYGDTGSIWDVDFRWTGARDPRPEGAGLHYIDHLTHNVRRGRMDHWSDWYAKLFNFRQIRFFNIEGRLTGLMSRALTSPCGKIRIPINESLDDKSQIEEFLLLLETPALIRQRGCGLLALGAVPGVRLRAQVQAADQAYADRSGALIKGEAV
mgnify:CR=1 FL=1